MTDLTNQTAEDKVIPIYSGLYKSFIQYVDINALKCPRWPTVTSSSVKAFSRSLAETGFLKPVFTDAQRNILDGRKRYAAAASLGYEKIPCVFAPSPLVFEDDLLLYEVRSESADYFKCAEMLRELTGTYLYSQEDAARAIGKSQSYVANKLRLLDFSEDERKEALCGGLTERHCRSLLKIRDPDLRRSALRTVASSAFSVSATEEYVSSLLENSAARDRVSAAFERLVSSLADEYDVELDIRRSDSDSPTYFLTVKQKRFT